MPKDADARERSLLTLHHCIRRCEDVPAVDQSRVMLRTTASRQLDVYCWCHVGYILTQLDCIATLLRFPKMVRIPTKSWCRKDTAFLNVTLPINSLVGTYGSLLSPPSEPVDRSIIAPKRLKLHTSNLTCVFPGTVQTRLLTKFSKRGRGQGHVTP